MSEAELKKLQSQIEAIQVELGKALYLEDLPLFDSLPPGYKKEDPEGKLDENDTSEGVQPFAKPFTHWRKGPKALTIAAPVKEPQVGAAVADVSWHPDSKRVLVCCQDGRVEIHDVFDNYKEYLITPPADGNKFHMACAFEPSVGDMFAVGGLDNLCTIYKPFEDETCGEEAVAHAVCSGHMGYVSDIGWLSPESVVTASGDTTCKLWDVETGKAKTTFYGHKGDACCLTTFEGDRNVFATGSVDHSVRVWDARVKGTFTAARFYVGSGVTAIKSLGPDVIGCCTDMVGMENGEGGHFTEDDAIGEARLLDIRCKQQLQFFRPESTQPVCFKHIEFSKSGRYMFLGSEDSWLFPFDVKTGEDYDPIRIQDKSERAQEKEDGAVGIAALEMSPDGTALCASVRGDYLTIFAS